MVNLGNAQVVNPLWPVIPKPKEDLIRVYLRRGPEQALLAAVPTGIHLRLGVELRSPERHDGDGTVVSGPEEAYRWLTQKLGEMILYGYKIEKTEGHIDNVRYYQW